MVRRTRPIEAIMWLIVLMAVLPFPVCAENYVDADIGIVYSDVSSSEITAADGNLDGSDASIHLAAGAYRNRDDSPWVYGVKLGLDDVGGNLLLSVRALDVGYKLTPRLTVNGFIGAAQWNAATSATGYHLGAETSYRFGDHWALGGNISYSDSVARDKLLPEENPGTGSPDIFYDILQFNLYLKYVF